MRPRSPSTVLRIGAVVFASMSVGSALLAWNALDSGVIDSRRYFATLADDPVGFWLHVFLYGLGLASFAMLAVVFWKGADGERRADRVMARRDIPLDRAIRAQQDPEA